MNTNFDKQRFGKCLKYRLTDRLMVMYAIMALIVNLPMMMVAYTTGAITFPMMITCSYTLFFGIVLANNKFIDTLLPATALEKFTSFCAAVAIYIAAIMAIVGSTTLVLSIIGWQKDSDFLNIPMGYVAMAVFMVMPIGVIVGNLRRINAQSAPVAMLAPMMAIFALVFLIAAFKSLWMLLAMAAVGLALWYLAYRGYCRRQVS